jgi:hypothetical protein
MRKLRDLLRLKYETGLSHWAIARACSIGVEHGLGASAARGGGGPAVALGECGLVGSHAVEASRKRRDVERGLLMPEGGSRSKSCRRWGITANLEAS